ncbi:MAG TPA: sugar phosphate nucleotidyltransferase [Candidatus Dormibacteraeota bacterium]|jgi:mannose-1-phosphate guanylyltransferase|nr:sugar phosphate nucleotidyltransferase [Candidatus Dormibacteraeota bacterium]
MLTEKLTIHAIILAGGRGTRFWPRSRTRTPKQLLNIVGKQTMLEQTVARLRPLISPDRIWSVTNAEQTAALKKQLPAASRKRVLTEPIGRNTAAAIALAAIHVRHAAKGDALMAVLPSDQFIAQPEKYRSIVAAALDIAREPGRMVVLGIPPTRPETGFGYVERMGEPINAGEFSAFAVRRFTEKPALPVAQEYVASGNYQWNAGMFFWRVSTFLDNLQRHLAQTHAELEKLAESIGVRSYEKKLRAIYPKLENISVDYAILERATQQSGPPQVFVIPAEIGWSDIGSWAAVYELLAKQPNENVFAGPGHALDASGNFLYSPSKFIAAIGVNDLVVVETPDALLICPRGRAQDVAKIVKHLEEQKRKDLL